MECIGTLVDSMSSLFLPTDDNKARVMQTIYQVVQGAYELIAKKGELIPQYQANALYHEKNKLYSGYVGDTQDIDLGGF